MSFHYPGFVRNLDFSVSTQGAYNDICTKEFSGELLDLSLFFWPCLKKSSSGQFSSFFPMQLFKIASRNFNVIFSHQRLVKLWSYTSWQVDCMTLFVYMKTINDKPYDFFSFLYNTLHVFFLFLFTNKVEHLFISFVFFPNMTNWPHHDNSCWFLPAKSCK